MTTDWILGWWNVAFVAPFGLALLYLVLYAVSGVTFGDPDADHDADHDLGHDGGGDAESDHDVDADQDVAADADAEVDHDAPGEPAGGPGPLSAALLWLGVGRVPLSILVMAMLLSWGAAGFLVNQLLREPATANGGEPWRVVLFSIPVATLAALASARVVSRAMSRWLPLDQTSARRRHELLGCDGTAIYPIDARFGMASVRDDRGELYQVPCRLAEGHAAPLPKGAAVRLVAYSARANLYQVVPAD